MEEGLRMLEKRYNVEFIIKNDRLKGDSFTGTFTNQRLERILEYFRLSSQIRWRYLDSPDMKDEKSKIEIYWLINLKTKMQWKTDPLKQNIREDIGVSSRMESVNLFDACLATSLDKLFINFKSLQNYAKLF